MSKEAILTTQAPAPIGPYSQAIKAGNMLFVSGQIALNPVNGELNCSNIQDETHLVMQNLKAVLQEAGLGFQHVVKSSIFLSSMDYFAAVNAVYATYFEAPFPARETVAVKTLPRQVNVEISVIAIFS